MGQNNRSVKTLTRETRGGAKFKKLTSMVSTSTYEVSPTKGHPLLVFDLLGHEVVDCESNWNNGSLVGITKPLLPGD